MAYSRFSPSFTQRGGTIASTGHQADGMRQQADFTPPWILPLRRCVALLIVAPLLAGCGESTPPLPPAPDGPLKIYSSFPVKGPPAYESTLVLRAIDLAVGEHNSNRQDLPVVHIALDGGSDENGEWSPRQEGENATVAAEDPQAIAYFGPYMSGATGVALPITGKAGLLTLGPTATWPGLTQSGWDAGEPERYYPTGKRNYGRLSLPDSRQGEAAARWAFESAFRRAYVLNDGSSYSAGLARHFEAGAKVVGLEVVGAGTFAEGNKGKVLETLTASKADSIFFAPSNAGIAISLASQLSQAGLAIPVFVSDTAMSAQFLDAVGERASAWRVIFNGASQDPALAEWASFATRFEAAYGVAPSQPAARAYDLARLTLKALVAVGKADRPAITARVLTTLGYRGASGTVTFDPAGDNAASHFTGYRIERGRFVLERDIEF